MTITLTTATIISLIMLELATLLVGGIIGALVMTKYFEKSMIEAEQKAEEVKKEIDKLMEEARKSWEQAL